MSSIASGLQTLLRPRRNWYSENQLMKHVTSRVAAFLCVLSCATVAGVEIWPVGRGVQTADQNGDGRPDLWRHFDARGQVTTVEVDSNFDGKPDIEEFYERGALVRRESDRNFNGQADLIEEFDAETHGQTRSVVDTDFDGTADLLLLYQDGRPVYSRRAVSNPVETRRLTASGTSASQLAPLLDPFESDTAVRAVRVAPIVDVCVGMSTSGGLPSAQVDPTTDVLPSAPVLATSVAARTPALLLPRSPRAPPLV